MQKTLHTFALALLTVCSVGVNAQNYAGGSGTEADPYQISNATELAYLAEQVTGGNSYAGTYFVLTDDILFNDITDWKNWDENTTGLNQWSPIGYFNAAGDKATFAGTFDGQKHTISGLYVSTTDKYQGLFAYLDESATVKNVGITASYIRSTNGFVAAIAAMNEGTITNCYNTGTIYSSNIRAAGIVADNYGSITCCYNTGTISGKAAVGGITGGTNTGIEVVANCYNTGNITAEYNVGGIIGGNISATITNCYSTGIVSATNNTVGGIIGINYGNVSNNYYLSGTATGGIASNDQAGQATALAVNEFADQSNFVNWDFETVWTMSARLGRPVLKDLNEEDNIPTALPNVAANNHSWSVSGSERTLHISGTTAEVAVYNITGKLVYSGMERTINVPAAGIYMVRIGKTTQRAIVK